jgi:hypothetical protein
MGPFCGLCGQPQTSSTGLDLHEIYNRGRIANTDLVDLLPVPLHALLCRRCNTNLGRIKADSKEGRKTLLIRSIELWGFDEVKAAIAAYNEMANQPIYLEEWEEILNDEQ